VRHHNLLGANPLGGQAGQPSDAGA
jgi:hypothetical protein